MENALRLGEIIDAIEKLREEGKTEEEIRNMICVLGDDEELNGYHVGYTVDPLKTDDYDYEDIAEKVGTHVKDGVMVIS